MSLFDRKKPNYKPRTNYLCTMEKSIENFTIKLESNNLTCKYIYYLRMGKCDIPPPCTLPLAFHYQLRLRCLLERTTRGKQTNKQTTQQTM